MSTPIVFVGQSKPEKNLVELRKYKAYLSPEQKKQILDELSRAIGEVEEWDISMHVEIELKKYDSKDTRV
jgi:hypothetical protein